MAEAFFQPGKSPLTRPASGLPVALSNTSEPKLSKSDPSNNVQPGQAIPCVVILTALPEEFLAVKAHLDNVREEMHPVSKTVYERGLFVSGQVTWDVVIVETGQGNANAADETQRAIAHFNPDVVLFVGVAGGRKDVAVGDVVVGNKVYNYESGRDEEVFKPRPEVGRASYPLEQRARAVVRAWLERRKQVGNEHLPCGFVGAIAAGESVVASTESETAKLLQRNYGDTLAVEKEGHGFLEAARRSQGVSAIVIRGISDLLDNKEQADKGGSQELAARHACEFAFEMLANLYGSGNSVARAATPKETVGQYQGGRINLDLNWKPPTSMAIFWLQQNDDDGYRLLGRHSQMQDLDISDCTTLPIELGQFIQFQPWNIDVVGRLERYQPRDCLIGEALKWLRYLRRNEPDFACLVIAEPPNSNVPWELLNLGNQILGVVLQTVRVSSIANNEDEDGARLLDATGYCCQGKAIVYACKNGSNEGTASFTLEFQSYIHETVSYTIPDQILEHLRKIDLKIGLIVMTDASLQQIGSDRRCFFLNRTRLFRRSPSLVILQPLPGDNSHRALAIELLEHGAEGVLGMLEMVDISILQKVIGLFFEEYR